MSPAAWRVIMAAIGSTFTGRPFNISKPRGVFIQALAMTTKTAEAAPLTATITPAKTCARAEMRFQPYR